MRTCAKLACGTEPVVTVSLAYEARKVLVAELPAERDPNLIELCRAHSESMTPPVGWVITDARPVGSPGR